MVFGKFVHIGAVAIALIGVHFAFGAETCRQRIDQLQQTRNQNGGTRSVGGFIPQCDETGNYKPKQSWGSTGYQFCVNSTTGEQISPSVRPWLFNLTCHPHPGYPNQAPFTQFPYHRKCSTTTGNGAPMPGAFVAQCDESGNFKQMQCWGSTGQCWCVNGTSGIPYSEMTRNLQSLHCNSQNRDN